MANSVQKINCDQVEYIPFLISNQKYIIAKPYKKLIKGNCDQ